MARKLLVTNLSALANKYPGALDSIERAIRRIVTADVERGIETELVDLSDASEFGPPNPSAVTDPLNPKQNKEAIDAAFIAAGRPQYLVIIGAPDIVPHQDLKNPLHSACDSDEFVQSDLPYACDAGYSQNIKHFKDPNRLVGRIPDIKGRPDSASFIKVLEAQARWESGSPKKYAAYFGLANAEWKVDAAYDLREIFHTAANLELSPPGGPAWPAKLLRRPSHFIKCHGAEGWPQFFSNLAKGGHQPSLAADFLNKHIGRGTIVATQCCYGAELYDPATIKSVDPTIRGQPAICNVYMMNEAYAYFGSTTQSYSRLVQAGEGGSDRICQYFFQKILRGASLGCAALEARLKYAEGLAQLEAHHLKTLAQFILLGDPSIQPVDAPDTKDALDLAFSDSSSKFSAHRHDARLTERADILMRGLRLRETKPVATDRLPGPPPPSVALVIERFAQQRGLKVVEVLAFAVDQPSSPMITPDLQRLPFVKREAYIAFARQSSDDSACSEPILLAVSVENGSVVAAEQFHTN